MGIGRGPSAVVLCCFLFDQNSSSCGLVGDESVDVGSHTIHGRFHHRQPPRVLHGLQDPITSCYDSRLQAAGAVVTGQTDFDKR